MRNIHTQTHAITSTQKNFDTTFLILSAISTCGVIFLYLAASGAIPGL